VLLPAQRGQVVQQDLGGGLVCQGGWAALHFGTVADAAEALRTCALPLFHS
jgi:hypothetical protein